VICPLCEPHAAAEHVLVQATGQGLSNFNFTFQGVVNMQTALAFNKSSINSLAATVTIALALTAGAAGGYWLKSQAAPIGTTAAQPTVARTSGQAAPVHDMPDEAGTQSLEIPHHDMPEPTGTQSLQVPAHDMPEQ
jgi:hypothetical protein